MSTITKEWLQQAISDYESVRDELPFGLGEDDSNTLAAMRIALVSLEAEAVAYTDAEELRFPHATSDMWPVPLGHGMDLPLYAAPPSPVSVPDDVMAAMQKVARIRLDLNDFDGDKRGILDCLGDAEEALIEVVNRRAAMLQGAYGNFPDGWVACSERLPENKPGSYEYLVFEGLNNRVQHDYWNVPDAGDDCQFTPFWNHYDRYVTHWMPMPAAPQQEVK
ncbi:DUF551 domain-containing protein [Escherichia coli]|nr:DUF551 domain-containing protein [Escherichia coli O53]HCX5860660.1 DUF551 domain-containing protein [Escherichia coli]